MEGYMGRPRRGNAYKKSSGGRRHKYKKEEKIRASAKNKVKEEKHLDIYGGLREDIAMERYLHGPMDYAKELRFRVGDLDLPERRKRCTSSREEDDVATNMCPCGTKIESRTHILG